METTINLHEEAKLVLRWNQGFVAKYVDFPKGEKTQGMKDLAKSLGHNSPTTLYEAIRLVDKFNEDFDHFYEWLTEWQDPEGNIKTKNWGHVIDLIRAKSDPDVYGKRTLVEQTARSIERAGQDLALLEQQANEGSIDQREVDGIRQKFVNEVARLSKAKDRVFEEEKEETPRSDEYMDYVRSLPCCVCEADPPSEPHHVEQGRVGKKGSDFSAIPLCTEHHDFIENDSTRMFEDTLGVRLGDLISKTLHYAISGQGLQIPKPRTSSTKR